MEAKQVHDAEIWVPEEKPFYEIPEWKLGRLYKFIDQMNRRADKLGLESIKTEELGEVFKPEMDEGKETGKLLRFVQVKVTGESPKLAGWQFIAVLQHEEGGNIVRTVPGYEGLTDAYRKVDPWCDHCQLQRDRRDTYIVRHVDTGETKQVGSGCLKDFTGHKDVHLMANWAEMFATLGEMLSDAESEDDFWGGGEGRGETYFDLIRFLATTSAVIREHGWMSRSKADPMNGQRSTADRVLDEFFPPRNVRFEKVEVTEGDEQHARDAIAWAQTLGEQVKEPNDYEWNLYIVSRQEAITFRMVGLAASMVSSYDRVIQREIEKQRLAERDKSEYVGEVKQRIDFKNLTCIYTNVIEGFYGNTYLLKFHDLDRNLIVWFSSNNVCDEGDVVNVRATVKEHSVFNGRKETIITRGSKVEIVGQVELTD